jgi:Rrf2 family transcriptional regulator, iron-sulfur cluster assembly transcription factor
MMLSRESEYGLEGLSVLARRPRGTVMLLQEIADARRLPSGFLARIFQKLRRHHLVASHRGAVRGYSLARPPGDISLREILEAIEGPDLFGRCIFRPRLCDEHEPCRLHEGWAGMRDTLERATEATTLEHVASRGHATAG